MSGYAALPCATASSSRRSSRRCCSPRARCPTATPGRFEVKWDGCRAQLRYDGRSVSLRTRHGRECSADFPELAAIAVRSGQAAGDARRRAGLPRPDGRPDFARLRRRLTGSATRRHPAMLQVFDVLHLDGRSTRPLPYDERRALLEELALDGPAWRTPASVVVDRTEDFVARVAELGLEGVVAKRLSSTYLPGRRCTSWVKHKLRREERLAVTGIRRNREGHVEAILVARRQTDGSFTGAGSIELGLRRELVELLEQRLAELPPADGARSPGIRPRCRWLPRFTARRTAPCATRCCGRYSTGEAARLPRCPLILRSAPISPTWPTACASYAARCRAASRVRLVVRPVMEAAGWHNAQRVAAPVKRARDQMRALIWRSEPHTMHGLQATAPLNRSSPSWAGLRPFTVKSALLRCATGTSVCTAVHRCRRSSRYARRIARGGRDGGLHTCGRDTCTEG